MVPSIARRTTPPAPIASRAGQISLGELVELVASLVPEEAVAATVVTLFDQGVASFAGPLTSDERTALRTSRPN